MSLGWCYNSGSCLDRPAIPANLSVPTHVARVVRDNRALSGTPRGRNAPHQAAPITWSTVFATFRRGLLVKPILQSLLLADKVYEDKATGKKIIAGIFNKLLLAQDPPPPTGNGAGEHRTPAMPVGIHAGSPSLYISLVDCKGKLPLSLRFVDLADNKVLMHAELSVECSDPLATVEIVIPMPPLDTPRPGVYALELLYDDGPLGSLRITADKVSPGENP
jgi:hypothetical protein